MRKELRLHHERMIRFHEWMLGGEHVSCNHNYRWSRYCGAEVCTECQDHKGLGRCFCGWNLAPGERLEDDIGEAVFDGVTWEVEY